MQVGLIKAAGAAPTKVFHSPASSGNEDRVNLGQNEPCLGLIPKTTHPVDPAHPVVSAQPPSKASLRECSTWEDTLKVLDQYAATVLITGFGSKCQYADPAAAQEQLDKFAQGLDQRYGKGRWLAVFGGDPFDQAKPDVAHMTRYLQEKHATPVMAFQNDVVKGWGGVDKQLDFVHYVPTAYEKKQQPDGSSKEVVIWGGFRDGKPQGPTASYLGSDLLSGPQPRLKAMVVIGGGDIAAQEAVYAKQQGVDVHYIKAQAKFPEAGQPYGAVDQVLANP